MAERSLDDVVLKPPTDQRLYRILHLPNGICALLIHDPDEDWEEEGSDEDDEMEDEDGEEERKKWPAPRAAAAAALCVKMGSFSDPSKAQGLAHFLEHMLFMGSSKFPDENEYSSYLSKHGGSSNAYTYMEYTSYHFEVNRGYLKGALERFSQFFVSPLVKAEAMDREVLAVDSEFNEVMQSDSCRLQQLRCHTTVPGHPFNRFFWGNKKSLIDATDKGINLRDEILQMYNENYNGGIMKLVVIGGELLNTLEDWVVELFGNVSAGHPLENNIEWHDRPIWKAGKIYRLEAVEDIHSLDLTWTLPCLRKEYLKKPEDYVSHLLGHGGKGSLLFYLKTKGWASWLSAGVGQGMCRSSIAYIFEMSISLTDSGLEKFNEVIGAVYQYIKLLRKSAPKKWIFKELQDIGNLEFRFAKKQHQDDYASRLAENMLYYSEGHIIYGEYAFKQWDRNLVKNVLKLFTPDNMRIDLLSKSFDKESQDILYEPWFGSRYTEEDVSSSLLQLWANQMKIDPSLHFPARNEFIPIDFLPHKAKSKDITNLNHPKCILNELLLKFWYKNNSVFNVPRANTYILITVKDGYGSLKNSVLTELFVNLLKDELNDLLYQASVAKLETSLSVTGDKMVLKIDGFNDKLSVLLSKILTLFKSFVPKADRFEVIKEDMERAYRNSNMGPLSYSSYLRLQVLQEIFWDVDDKLSCLVNLSLSNLKAFIPKLLHQVHIEGLCHGNLSKDEAISIANMFKNIFSIRPLRRKRMRQERILRQRILRLPHGARFSRSVCVKNEHEMNSVVTLYFQIEQDIGTKATKLRAITDFFSNIIKEPYFNQLRTKEQLGYTVGCRPQMTYRVLGFIFQVQSSNYNPVYVHGRINNFINDLPEYLDGLDDGSFENHRNALIEQKLKNDPSPLGEIWTQIEEKRYLFDINKREAEKLKTIRKSDLINWYNTYLRPESPKCRRLAVHVWGCNTNFAESKMQDEFVEIDDVYSFKTTSKFYRGLC